MNVVLADLSRHRQTDPTYVDISRTRLDLGFVGLDLSRSDLALPKIFQTGLCRTLAVHTTAVGLPCSQTIKEIPKKNKKKDVTAHAETRDLVVVGGCGRKRSQERQEGADEDG